MSGEYLDLAESVVKLALKQGASDVECNISEGREFSVTVRLGEVETLKEAGSRAAGVRVLCGKRAGSSYTSDLTPEGIEALVKAAIEIARLTGEDPHAGLPDDSEFGKLEGDLGLFSPEAERLTTEEKIRLAREVEAASLATDRRIENSEGGSFSSNVSEHTFANSRRFSGAYRTSSCSISAVPIARQNGAMERDYWYSLGRDATRLESPQEVGRKAAERALRRLGARKINTQKAAVVFEPRTARSLLDNLFEAVHGDSIYKNASFLAGKLGERVAAPHITVIDDGTLPGLFGTSPYDDEGVPSRRTPVIENGVLRNYLLNAYTARKLGMKTTGNASRGITGNAGIGHGNFYLEKGRLALAEILKAAGTGLYVTELIGFGVNIVTGDYSRGAAGIWFENGELQYPVSEVTIAGNLNQMLMDLEWIGSDLEFRGSTASPTLGIREMTISGQ